MTKCKFSDLNAGDWFEVDGERYICLVSEGPPYGRHRSWSIHSGTNYFEHNDQVTPLPDCTGWDWESEPQVFYRNEYADRDSCGKFIPELGQLINLRASHRDFIGYTIRRVWPDGRIEQEFVPKEKS